MKTNLIGQHFFVTTLAPCNGSKQQFCQPYNDLSAGRPFHVQVMCKLFNFVVSVDIFSSYPLTLPQFEYGLNR